jgi:hypothetical protein
LKIGEGALVNGDQYPDFCTAGTTLRVLYGCPDGNLAFDPNIKFISGAINTQCSFADFDKDGYMVHNNTMNIIIIL